MKILLSTIAGAVLAVALTGCGGADTAADDSPGSNAHVATLETPSASSASGSPAADERPVIRPDADSADINKLENAYDKCLDVAGVPINKDADGNYGKPEVAVDDPDYRGKFQSCANKEPESWIDRERRTDPQFIDRLREAVACLNRRGFKARLEGDPPSIGYSTPGEFARADQAEDECQRQAFREVIASYSGN